MEFDIIVGRLQREAAPSVLGHDDVVRGCATLTGGERDAQVDAFPRAAVVVQRVVHDVHALALVYMDAREAVVVTHIVADDDTTFSRVPCLRGLLHRDALALIDVGMHEVLERAPRKDLVVVVEDLVPLDEDVRVFVVVLRLERVQHESVGAAGGPPRAVVHAVPADGHTVAALNPQARAGHEANLVVEDLDIEATLDQEAFGVEVGGSKGVDVLRQRHVFNIFKRRARWYSVLDLAVRVLVHELVGLGISERDIADFPDHLQAGNADVLALPDVDGVVAVALDGYGAGLLRLDGDPLPLLALPLRNSEGVFLLPNVPVPKVLVPVLAGAEQHGVAGGDDIVDQGNVAERNLGGARLATLVGRDGRRDIPSRRALHGASLALRLAGRGVAQGNRRRAHDQRKR
mmetsp:Transcript_24378/g.70509  ORF Transcript_24378/g.70509 Transcript_24378/m.70509 type:complete len:403 (+) Transcript_24378:370-1578(+)